MKPKNLNEPNVVPPFNSSNRLGVNQRLPALARWGLWASLLLALPLAAYGQYRSGYVIQGNDTTYGQIKYQSGPASYESCRFTQGAQTIDYDPSQVSGYGFVNDKSFVAGITPGRFVEVLVHGRLNLYKEGQTFIVQRADGESFRLERKMKRVETTGRIIEVEDLSWKGILFPLIGDCDRDLSFSEMNTLNEKNITGLVVEYNRCTGEDFIELKKGKRWLQLEYGFFGGVVQSTIRFTRKLYVYQAEQYRSVDPHFGILFALSAPRISESLALQMELQFNSSSFSSQIYREPPRDDIFYTNVDLTTMTIPVLLVYTLPEMKYTPFVQMGFSYAYHFESDATVRHEWFQNNTLQVNEEEAFTVLKSQWGLLAGIGVARAINTVRVGMAARYAYNPNLNTTVDYDGPLYKGSFSLYVSKR